MSGLEMRVVESGKVICKENGSGSLLRGDISASLFELCRTGRRPLEGPIYVSAKRTHRFSVIFLL
jgi:hypothetical protein